MREPETDGKSGLSPQPKGNMKATLDKLEDQLAGRIKRNPVAWVIAATVIFSGVFLFGWHAVEGRTSPEFAILCIALLGGTCGSIVNLCVKPQNGGAK
jgi:hypothetical protein